ncbi:MAG: EAL domain-containing protein, partial [Candidatus Enteromonas sp.]
QASFNRVVKNRREYGAMAISVHRLDQTIFLFLRHKAMSPLLKDLPVLVIADAISPQEEARLKEYGVTDICLGCLSKKELTLRLQSILFVAAEKHQESLLEKDELTGILTRQAFFQKAASLLEETGDKSYTLILGDIVGLKEINDLYGAEYGDGLIQYLARSCFLTPGALAVGRYEGDHIAVLASANHKATAEAVFESEERLRRFAPIKNASFHFGVVHDVEKYPSIDDAFSGARVALASIHETRGIAAATYTRAMEEHLREEERFRRDFGEAIQRGDFLVYYQPKFSVSTGKVEGAEALVRWKMPDGTLVGPTEFIKVFEKDERIFVLDQYVFEQVVSFLSSLREEGLPLLPISVNLSRYTLFLSDVASRYARIASARDIPLSCVPLEITETAAVSARDLQDFAEGLYRRGFLLHMDDFGAGESSLYSLDAMRFDAIKIDKSLIDMIGNPRADRTLCHVIDLAKELGMGVVAEGVETKEQWAFLRSTSCDEIQGFYFARPMPESDFKALLSGTTPLVSRSSLPPFAPLDRSGLARLLFDEGFEGGTLLTLAGAFGVFYVESGHAYVLSATPAFEKLLGITLTPGEPAPLGSYLSEEVAGRLDEALSSRVPLVAEVSLPMKDGPKTIEVSSRFLREEGKGFLSYASFRDCTLEAKRNAFLETMPGGVLYASTKEPYEILFANPKVWALAKARVPEEFYRFTRKSLRGLLTESSFDAFLSSLEKAEETGDGSKILNPLALWVRAVDGSTGQAKVYGRLVHDAKKGDSFFLLFEPLGDEHAGD